jgi:hypothetical protein
MVDTSLMRRFLAILILLAASPALAGGIVLEAYNGERPADASRLLSPILDELAARGFSGGDTLARTYEGKVSRPGQTPKGLPGDFAAQIDGGFKAWVGGRFVDAIKTLGPLVDLAHDNSGLIAKDQSLRDPLLKGLIALALSQQRNGDQGATKSTFAEIVRSYPEAQLTRSTYGAEAVDLFEQVRHEISAAGKGKLTIEVDGNAVVFVDERYGAVGTTTLDLVPGEYRVCALSVDKQPSRSHRMIVRPNENPKLTIDVGLDRALVTTAWTGFLFANAGDRENHEGTYAAHIAVQIGATAVAVVGIDQVRGRPAIVGSLVSMSNGREIRRASVAMEPDPSTERLKALARYLAGDEPAAGLEVQTPGAAPVHVGDDRRDDNRPSTSRWGGWKWLAAGGAVVGLGVGGYLAYEDGRCQDTPQPGRSCANVYATSPADYIALGAGAALAGVAIYLFATGDSHPAHTAYVVPAAGGALVGWGGRF